MKMYEHKITRLRLSELVTVVTLSSNVASYFAVLIENICPHDLFIHDSRVKNL